MTCKNCGNQNIDGFAFCTNCGAPLANASVPSYLKASVPAKRKKGLAFVITAAAALLIGVILVLVFTANPIAGRWYSQSGTELILLQNGKGMTVSGSSDEAKRVHFMYAIEYREAGYIEGEIYEKDSGTDTWFYLYDGALELGNEYFYRQKPAVPIK